MTEVEISSGYALELRQRFTLMQNRYDLVAIGDGGDSTIAYAEQKRFSLKEKVTFWSGEDRSAVAFTIAARNVLELAGTYDVCDAGGNVLATIHKDGRSSILRSTYVVDVPGRGTVRGQERGGIKAILRRLVNVFSDFPWPLPIHFDFSDEHGTKLCSIERRMAVRDVYKIQVNDSTLDWRITAALGVAVDAFMNR
jgi:uncharacterized protein YxjI